MLKAGQRLHDERIKKGLSISDVSQATKIRQSFLIAIEKGEYHRLPSAAYATGFVRNYAEYLGLPKREIFALFRREFDEEKIYKVLPDSLTPKKEFPRFRIRIQRTLLVLGGVISAFFVYVIFQYRFFVMNPPLQVLTPKEGSNTSREVIVTGKTDPNATVFVNTFPVVVDVKGVFMKKLTLSQGTTVILVKAKNRLNKETIVQRNIRVSE